MLMSLRQLWNCFSVLLLYYFIYKDPLRLEAKQVAESTDKMSLFNHQFVSE